MLVEPTHAEGSLTLPQREGGRFHLLPEDCRPVLFDSAGNHINMV